MYYNFIILRIIYYSAKCPKLHYTTMLWWWSVTERPFVKRFALCYRAVVCTICLSACNVGVLWSNGWMDQDVTWYGGRPRPRPHCVRWGHSYLPPRKGCSSPPQFSAHDCCSQTVAHIGNCWALVFYTILLSSVLGNIHYTNCRHSSNEGFWKINLVFWNLWSVFVQLWSDQCIRALAQWRLKELLKRLYSYLCWKGTLNSTN